MNIYYVLTLKQPKTSYCNEPATFTCKNCNTYNNVNIINYLPLAVAKKSLTVILLIRLSVQHFLPSLMFLDH